jgi:hypothetical protein
LESSLLTPGPTADLRYVLETGEIVPGDPAGKLVLNPQVKKAHLGDIKIYGGLRVFGGVVVLEKIEFCPESHSKLM